MTAFDRDYARARLLFSLSDSFFALFLAILSPRILISRHVLIGLVTTEEYSSSKGGVSDVFALILMSHSPFGVTDVDSGRMTTNRVTESNRTGACA
jgi:hypothetical protein